MNRKVIAVSLASLLLAGALLAHGGHKHKILGTVKLLHENHLVLTDREGVEVTVVLGDETKLVKGDDETATREDLTEGTRVAVEVKDDGKTAISVKIGSKKE